MGTEQNRAKSLDQLFAKGARDQCVHVQGKCRVDVGNEFGQKSKKGVNGQLIGCFAHCSCECRVNQIDRPREITEHVDEHLQI